MKSSQEEIKALDDQIELINAEVAMHEAELKWEIWDERSDRDRTRKKFLELRIAYLKKTVEPLTTKLQALQRTLDWERNIAHPQPLNANGCPKCQHLACVCSINEAHKPDCKFRRAATCTTPVPCARHNRDTCPVCDPCTCGPAVKKASER